MELLLDRPSKNNIEVLILDLYRPTSNKRKKKGSPIKGLVPPK
jgi:hypothetical protein